MTTAGHITIELPEELVRSLESEAAAMNLTLKAYIVYLRQCRRGRLDAGAAEATRFTLRNHAESLRKLAE